MILGKLKSFGRRESCSQITLFFCEILTQFCHLWYLYNKTDRHKQHTKLFWNYYGYIKISYSLYIILLLNYWLEYLDLDLVFFYKCMKGDIIFARHFNGYFSFLRGWSHHSSTELYLNTNTTRTSHLHDYFFNRITILWNSIPDSIKLATSLYSFKHTVQSLFICMALTLHFQWW